MKHHWLLAACIGYCLGSGCVCCWLGRRLKAEREHMELRERMIRLLGRC
jgi:hypothetical protein